LFSDRGTAALHAPEPSRAFKRRAAVTEMPLRRDSTYPSDYAQDDPGDEFSGRARRPGVRVSFDGGILPKSRWGRLAAGCGLAVVAVAGIATALAVRSYVMHDEHFVVAGSDSIQIVGNSHLTRPQLLSVLGEDVDRNIFGIPLSLRRAELESLPWVQHATVMRLLPNRVRIAIVERTPVAFVRQGAQIGLVDANGVLFDLPDPESDPATSSAMNNATKYSFPVLTGLLAADPLSTRAARMRIYTSFLSALDSTGEKNSGRLSEVDLSNPEDVKAIIPDRTSSSGADILVHFGEEKFLERYHQYQAHLAEWRAQYPHLASADMRYERQVVLQMQPGTTVPNGDSAPVAAASDPAPVPTPDETTPKASAAAAKTSSILTRPTVRSVAPANATTKAAPKAPSAASPAKPAKPARNLTTAFPVTPLGAKINSTHAADGAASQGAPQ